MSEIIIPNNIPETQSTSVSLEDQSPWKKWAGLGVLTLGLAIVVIDTTLLNVSLSSIIKDLNTDLQSLQWVITGYALVLAAFTITGGRFGDLFGRKKMFMLGAIIFAIGSFIASISHSIPVLLLGEAIIEGFGAALMMPATSSLVVANFSGKERATAFGVWGAAAGASSAIGPLLGGYLTSHYSWRWGFRINIFVAAIVVLGALFLIKESLDERKPKLDWWGVLLSSLGLLGIVFAIIESSTLGWWHAKKAFEIFGSSISFGSLSLVPITLLFGAIVLAIFAWWELRLEKQGKSPLVSMALLKNQQFTSGALTTAILTLGMTGMIFALPVFLQTVKHLNAFDTGLALLPLSLALLVVAPLSGGVLSKKITPKYIILTGLLIDVAAAFILRATISVNVPVSHLIFGLSIYGLGMGLVFPPISNLVLSAVPVQMSGEASGVNNTLRQVGSTLGAAIIGAAILTSLSTHLVAGISASQVIPQSAKAQIIQTVQNPDSNVQFNSNSGLPATVPQAVRDEMAGLVNQASAAATKDAYVYSALFAFLCFIAALFLPKTNVNVEGSAAEVDHSPKKFALAGTLFVLGIFGAFLLLHQSAKKVIATGSVSADYIRSEFAPPQNNTVSPQVEGAQTVATSTSEALPVLPRGEDAAKNNSSVVLTPHPVIYKNPNMGFQMQIDSVWQPTEDSSGQTVVFTNAQGQTITVQSYQEPDGNLDLVRTQLEGSPSVSNVKNATFLNQPALEFTSGQSHGWAVIYNNKLFYITTTVLNASPLSTFAFL